MAKKITITESQLKKLTEVVVEQKFDDVITKYEREKRQGIELPLDELRLLVNLSSNWCRGKENHPDCDDVLKIKAKLSLY